MREELLLLDGHSLAYRAFFALPAENFSTSTGQHTNAGLRLHLDADQRAARRGADARGRGLRRVAQDLPGRRVPPKNAKAARPRRTEFSGQLPLLREVLVGTAPRHRVAQMDSVFEAAAENPATATREQLRQMLQSMLANRFKLTLHREFQDVRAMHYMQKVAARLEVVDQETSSPWLFIVDGRRTLRAGPDSPDWLTM